MSIPAYKGPRTYFVLAEVEPKEVMNFGVTEGIPVDTDVTVEILGHALALWKPAPQEIDFNSFSIRAGDVFAVALAIDALLRLEERGEPPAANTAGDLRLSLARHATIHSWLEIREHEARSNIIGTVHSRYRLGGLRMNGDDAERFKVAARAAWNATADPHARLAFKDLAASMTQRGDDGFLYAFRAVENVRRGCAPDTVDKKGNDVPDWDGMHSTLGTSKVVLQPLTEAATSIRHGNDQQAKLIAVREEPAREQTLRLADDVLMRFAQHRGFVPRVT